MRPLLLLAPWTVAVLACGSRTDVGHDRAVVAPPDAVVLDAAPDTSTPADADVDAPAPPGETTLEVELAPAARVQLAIWVEHEPTTTFSTIALTEAVALRGIGNRPGASQMNSGYRWPYGRREGVLPHWAARRLAFGQPAFPRVIFQDRVSEGFASRTSTDFSRDDYFCLSFDAATTRRDGLDAVSCASLFHSDKGRFMTDADVAAAYAEPLEVGGVGTTRPLDLFSPYPPRRDVSPLENDHPDVATFDAVAREAMPEIDAVSLATPAVGRRTTVRHRIPAALVGETLIVHVEANTEGDYADGYDPTVFPTPTLPEELWDYWAINYGYPYRGQPSVVFRVEIETPPGTPTERSTLRPIGHTTTDGTASDLVPMDDMLDDPVGAPGSGADRLRVTGDGFRVRVRWSG